MVEPESFRTLEECLARIRHLEEENAHLRESAKTFGDLAERLKRALEAELRLAGGGLHDRPVTDDRAVIDADPAGLAK